MADSNPAGSNPTFIKGFLPGLVIGLLVGLAVGAFVVPLLDRGGLPDAPSGPVKRSDQPRERDPRPAGEPAPTDLAPANPAATPPANSPAPQTPASTPATTSPAAPATPATQPPKP